MAAHGETLELARLRARVTALEQALERRSEQLRQLQRHLTRRELVNLSRLTGGLPPMPLAAHQLEQWRETTDLTAAEVPETLRDLWRSLTLPNLPPTGTGIGASDR
ncbi:MAG TPA: hypothetical protein VN783_09170 [Thermoanaerobaculia bacterium]|nr:hypothetical protein [Thermoanaerobaculia bacterium]